MRCVGIELNLLEMLEGETIRSETFDPNEWSLEDIAILRRVANFIEEEQNDQRQENQRKSEQTVKNLQPKTH